MSNAPEVVQKVLGKERAYWTGVGALIVFNSALAMFAYTPLLPEPNPLLWIEIAIIVSSTLAIVGMIGNMVNLWHRLTRWSFLFTVFSTSLVVTGFVLGETEVAASLRIEILLFLIVGLLVSIHMHVGYGGPDPLSKTERR